MIPVLALISAMLAPNTEMTFLNGAIETHWRPDCPAFVAGLAKSADWPKGRCIR